MNEEVSKRVEEMKKWLLEVEEDLTGVTCCFTGHRQQKLPWRANEEDKRCLLMINRTKEKIEKAIKEGYKHFISGMAIGFDMICAEIVLELKEKYPNITLECALPCRNQHERWSKNLQIRYENILNKADKIRCIYKTYIKGCMHERNRYMISNSSLVISLFDNIEGGTKISLDFAKKMGRKIEIIKSIE